ncbi:MAG: hypothetical protein RMH75_07110 [Archaeoglobaceae archaeon]|nr:hypothetical protein [Archaeoglobaceae archaeon]
MRRRELKRNFNFNISTSLLRIIISNGFEKFTTHIYLIKKDPFNTLSNFIF